MWIKRTIVRQGLTLVFIPFVFQLVFVWLVASLEWENFTAQQWALHTRDVLIQAQVVLHHLLDAETGNRGYVVTGDPVFAEPYQKAAGDVEKSLAELHDLVRDNPAQQGRVDQIAAAASQFLAWSAKNDRLVRAGQREQAIVRTKSSEGKQLMDRMREQIAAFVQEEDRLNARRDQELDRARQRLRWLLVGGTAASFLVSVSLALVFSRGMGARLAVLTENMRRVALGKNLAPPLGGADDLAELDRAFRRMAEELARSNQNLRESEELFRLMTDNAVDYAMIFLDPEGRVVHWNTGAERIKGYRREEVVGKHFSLFYPPESIERGWPEKELQAAAREGRIEDEGWRIRKDGSRFWASVVITALRNSEGRLQGYSKLTRDLTERKRSTDAINQLNEELEQRVALRTAELTEANHELAQKNQENETFVYSVSHDLRSPLVNLQGFGKELGLSCGDLRVILTESDLPAPVRQRALALVDQEMGQSIHFIQSAVTRLGNIIDALLRLSRAGRFVPQWQPVVMDAIVARIVDSLKGTIAERQAQIDVQPLPPAYGDPTTLERIFANLLSNALNYLDPKRPGRIEVGMTGSPAEGESRTYYVRDNGMGIPAIAQPKIFQAFQRFHPEQAHGEGMGLALIRRLVERHGGKIWFESIAGTGTTFFVTLPGRPPFDASKATAGEGTDGPSPEARAG